MIGLQRRRHSPAGGRLVRQSCSACPCPTFLLPCSTSSASLIPRMGLHHPTTRNTWKEWGGRAVRKLFRTGGGGPRRAAGGASASGWSVVPVVVSRKDDGVPASEIVTAASSPR